MKRPIILVAAAVMAAGCIFGAAGCKGGNTVNRAVLSSNWYSGTGFKGFQPTICENENFTSTVGKEKITYTVTHEPLAEKYRNKYYSVSYGGDSQSGKEATYTTEFFAAEFSADAYAYPDSYKEGYSKAGNITAYCYKTVLEIPTVTFTLKNGESETFRDDSIETVSWFLSVKDYLRPLYSKQTVKSVSPNMLQPNSLKDGVAYKKYDRVYENFYSFDGTKVRTKTTDNLAEENKETESGDIRLDKAKNSLFDINSLDIVARASNLSAGSGLLQAISLYIPKSGKIENFNFAGSSTPLVSDEEAYKALKTELEEKLGAKGLYIANDSGLQTVAVSVNYNSAQPGGSQTYWFAAIGNKRNNTGRATMLKFSQPVSYNLGSVNYTLKSFESNLWNG